jgi:hypothetical protein
VLPPIRHAGAILGRRRRKGPSRREEAERRERLHRPQTARFRRLVDAERVDELDAEYLISAWEQEAESRGLDRHSDRYWTEAEGWFAEQRRRA